MTDEAGALSVGVIGGEYLGLAVRLAALGLPVRLWEPDPVDAVRVRDMAEKFGAGNLVAAEPDALATAALLLGDAPPAGAGISGPARVTLDWTSEDRPAFNPLGDVVELLGPDTTGAVGALAARMAATLVHLPAKSLPPSEILRARLSVAVEELCLDGASPHDIDTALAVRGIRPGPFLAQDARGVDVALAARRAILARLGETCDLPLFARAVAEGRLGRKAGVGWYRYPGNGGPVEDPLVEDMAAEEAHFAGIAQQRIPAGEIAPFVLRRIVPALSEARDRSGLEAVALAGIAEAAIGLPRQTAEDMLGSATAARTARSAT